MREITVIHKNTCDRCHSEIDGEPLTLYKKNYDSWDKFDEVADLCDSCWDKVMDFILKESE